LSTSEIRAEIRRLIQTDSDFDFFRDSCTWPDHPRKRADEHFVNLRRDSTGINGDEQCPTAPICTLAAIDQEVTVLSSASSDADKLRSLKYLGHWVGDIHQPLNVSFESDRGGKDLRVAGECRTNMQATWDACLLHLAIGSDVLAAAGDLVSSITPALKEEWVTTNPRDWANESFAIAVAPTTRYCVQVALSCDEPPTPVTIDNEYVETNVPIVREQLQKAGVRLAHLLEAALRTEPE
jgi:hypothetical protein